VLVTDTADLKPRSRDVNDGVEKAAAHGMLRAVGMTDDDFSKPQIGVASSWNEITPCNLSLDRLAKAAKDGVHAAGGTNAAITARMPCLTVRSSKNWRHVVWPAALRGSFVLVDEAAENRAAFDPLLGQVDHGERDLGG
jgi:hypothetical protein